MASNKKNILKITQQQFGKMYKYHDIIDQGSYGVVCKYEDLQTKQFVAIKVLKQDDGIQEFKNQEDIMKKINHQNVLKCLGFYYNMTKCRYLLVMPFCDNNLKKSIGQISQFDEAFKIGLCLQIARGLNALHQKNIMHRDIKPANILVCRDWKLKLCDFGFGKEDQGLNKTIKIGTPVYRDPNTHSGKYSKKCDIYSAGLVFDLIFRGKSIFENVSQERFPIQLTYFLRNQKKIVSALNCCEQMKNIILGCVVQEENKRFDSHQLLEKLQALQLKFTPNISQDQVAKKQTQIQQPKQKQLKIQQNNQQLLQKSFSLEIQQEKKLDNEKKFNKMVKQIDHINNIPHINVTNTKINRISTLNSKAQNTQNDALFTTQMPKFMTKHISIQSKNEKSLNQKTHQDLGVKLLKSSIEISKNLQKNLNFQTVYTYFVNRKNLIRELQDIQKLKSINQNDKKIVIFLALFGYLRFLKVSKSFLEHDKSTLKNIEGVPIQKISEGTISNCLQIINKQTQKSKALIKPCLLDLYQDKIYYKQKLSKNVIKYLSEGYEKKFIQIEQYQQHQISQEYENVLMNQRYVTYDESEIKLKKKLLQINKVF